MSVGSRTIDPQFLAQSLSQPAEVLPPLLGVVNQIKISLQKAGYTVVLGSPGSGKSEQLALALPSPAVTFDLRARFLSSYFETHQIRDPADKDGLKQNCLYPTAEFKKLEQEWLIGHFEELKENLSQTRICSLYLKNSIWQKSLKRPQ